MDFKILIIQTEQKFKICWETGKKFLIIAIWNFHEQSVH
jgi:hypothetical protein